MSWIYRERESPPMAKKPKLDETDIRRDLTASFVTKLRDKWFQVGDQVLDELAAKQPEKFALIVSQVVPREMLLAGGRGDFSECQSMSDIGRKLLLDVGVEELAITEAMITRAVELNNNFTDQLQAVAAGASH
jgi:hypothetical protein